MVGEILRLPQDDNAFQVLLQVFIAQHVWDIVELKNCDEKIPPCPPLSKWGMTLRV
jgi:hypothetical protein